MCKCTPGKRTPFCGKPGCEWPNAKPVGARRADTMRHVPAETAILDAMRAVEAMPPDERLTDAVVLLSRAKDCVADYVDGVPRRPAA
jgi:hypothetical protein